MVSALTQFSEAIDFDAVGASGAVSSTFSCFIAPFAADLPPGFLSFWKVEAISSLDTKRITPLFVEILTFAVSFFCSTLFTTLAFCFVEIFLALETRIFALVTFDKPSPVSFAAVFSFLLVPFADFLASESEDFVGVLVVVGSVVSGLATLELAGFL